MHISFGCLVVFKVGHLITGCQLCVGLTVVSGSAESLNTTLAVKWVKNLTSDTLLIIIYTMYYFTPLCICSQENHRGIILLHQR